MTDPDFDQFILAKKGNQYEFFEVGQRFTHHWGRTFTAADSILFSTGTCNWTPMYVNAEYAKAHEHPDIVINPMLVLCTAVGMSVEDLSEGGGPFLGVNDIDFVQSVYPGDTITAHSEVLDKRESTSHPDAGIVTWRTEATNQNGESVLRYSRTNLIRKAAAA
ncbi:acyl dehydratase [Antricoccus suffuscus]|uniref:Acyl dehydratase n=1 Tax=Antricoccus suffuscus TaxID=1629062 RepID=A0A2T1A6B8_9ACTN|nr:MaoC family dehydratase [Antricoccus suffuscus]PRZ44141.1 acyl dehydratase [Antricoccus suffuscus]